MPEVKERPILMSAPMVIAILAGDKTQTRRIVKLYGHDGLQSENDLWRFCEFHGEKAVWQHCQDIRRVITEKCRYGVPGDRLWVKETWKVNTPPSGALYRADANSQFVKGPWKPSIFMFRWASRITLEITNVRAERLQDISEDDCIAEGIEPVAQLGIMRACGWKDYSGKTVGFLSPRDSYKSLWESINGAGSWDLNPWDFAISFRKI